MGVLKEIHFKILAFLNLCGIHYARLSLKPLNLVGNHDAMVLPG